MNIFNNDLFMMHIFDEEGESDTRTGRINAAIKELRSYPWLLDADAYERVYRKYSLLDITMDEHRMIEERIRSGK